MTWNHPEIQEILVSIALSAFEAIPLDTELIFLETELIDVRLYEETAQTDRHWPTLEVPTRMAISDFCVSLYCLVSGFIICPQLVMMNSEKAIKSALF